MQRLAKIFAAIVFAVGIFAAGPAVAFGGHGGWGGGWHGGWGLWGYPYGYWPYGYGYDYPYGYGYPPPQGPALSPYCATRTRICTLRHPRRIGAGCSCRGAHGVISMPPAQ